MAKILIANENVNYIDIGTYADPNRKIIHNIMISGDAISNNTTENNQIYNAFTNERKIFKALEYKGLLYTGYFDIVFIELYTYDNPCLRFGFEIDNKDLKVI
jgi:hypothetical protein